MVLLTKTGCFVKTKWLLLRHILPELGLGYPILLESMNIYWLSAKAEALCQIERSVAKKTESVLSPDLGEYRCSCRLFTSSLINAIIRISVQGIRTGFLEEVSSKIAKWLGVNYINEQQIILQRRNHFYGGLRLRQKAKYYRQTEGHQSHVEGWEWVKRKFWASLLRICTPCGSVL